MEKRMGWIYWMLIVGVGRFQEEETVSWSIFSVNIERLFLFMNFIGEQAILLALRRRK
jgi:hypothetical protein